MPARPLQAVGMTGDLQRSVRRLIRRPGWTVQSLIAGASTPFQRRTYALSLYTFFLRRADGDATAFEIHELLDDAAAASWGGRVAAAHTGAAYVEVFHGDREVITVPLFSRSA